MTLHGYTIQQQRALTRAGIRHGSALESAAMAQPRLCEDRKWLDATAYVHCCALTGGVRKPSEPACSAWEAR